MTKTPEQLESIIRRVRNHEDVSTFQTDRDSAGTVNLVAILSNIPKAQIPKPNLLRARNKILDRISLPSDNGNAIGWSLLSGLPRFMRITGGIVGAFTIVLSLTLGTAVAALESIPGQPIYPVKKIVESVQLKLAADEQEKANLQIKFANTRVDELESILQKQKEGKASNEQVQKVVASTAKDIQKTSQTVNDQSKDQPNVNLLAKIVTLSNKQAAVIEAAKIESEGDMKIELEKALESTKISKEQAIENIEKAGLVVEESPLQMTDATEPAKEKVSASGKITVVSSTLVSIGTAQFTLTKDTEYVNIKPVDLKVGMELTISGEVRDKKTYAVKIEAKAPAKVEDQPVQQVPTGTNTQTIPADPTETP
jgi:hypothetical protein